MYGKKRRVLFTVLLVIFVTSIIVSAKPKVEGKQPSYFTLVAKTNTGGVRVDYFLLIKQQLARIGINLDVIPLDWPTFVGELIAFRNFDMCIVPITGGNADPDFTGVYNENGSLNLFGYHTDMDYDPALGTGKNEWYMRQGNLIMPPDSEERIQHYWDWQQYLMDEILPMKPLLTSNFYEAHWGNLNGYNFSDGLFQSWGKMSWTGSHLGQLATNEVVVQRNQWSDLNPLYQDDSDSAFVTNAITDPLFWYDSDNSVWPHLAKSWVHLNDTHLRITLREGVKWQSDLDGNFTNEYLDAEDLYFTLYMWRYSFSDIYMTEWIEELQLVDKYTLDIFIDGDSDTQENEPFAPYLTRLGYRILPEHYLNQTQTGGYRPLPDTTHPSWNTYATNPFGTGLFELTSTDLYFETILNVFPDCWRLNSTVTDDPALNWDERFGDYSGGLDELRIRHIDSHSVTLAEFEQGRIDFVGVSDDTYQREQFEVNPDITVNAKIRPFYLMFVGYNMRPVRPVIGSYDSWGPDPTITKGLAIRKAISYAIDVDEINQVIHGGEYTKIYHPIYTSLGVWCNPNIIKYDFDLDKALTYMQVYGQSTSNTIDTSYYPLFIIAEILLCAVCLIKRKK
ncbi:MAG: ABC transporter substrate-binding protein [Candidatus Heimdallarchaeota archaeon]